MENNNLPTNNFQKTYSNTLQGDMINRNQNSNKSLIKNGQNNNLNISPIEQKFSSSNQHNMANIDQVYSNFNIDLLVKTTKSINSGSINYNVNQSNLLNDEIVENRKTNFIEENNNQINRFNSSSSQPITNNMMMSVTSNPNQNSYNFNNNNINIENSLNDLSFLSSMGDRKLSSTANIKVLDSPNYDKNSSLNQDRRSTNFNNTSNYNNMNLQNSTYGNNNLNFVDYSKSIDFSQSDMAKKFNSSNSQSSDQKKSDLLNNNLNNILNSQKIEDIFHLKLIKNQLRGTIIVNKIIYERKKEFW